MSLFSSTIPFDKAEIERAIEALEQQSAAELRVYIEPYLQNAPLLEHCLEIFNRLEMHRTQARNAVLIYIAYKDHQCAIIGDEGIHQFVGNEFWQQAAQLMVEHFKRRQHTQAVIAAIDLIGRELALHFPVAADDINELPNEVIIHV